MNKLLLSGSASCSSSGFFSFVISRSLNVVLACRYFLSWRRYSETKATKRRQIAGVKEALTKQRCLATWRRYGRHATPGTSVLFTLLRLSVSPFALANFNFFRRRGLHFALICLAPSGEILVFEHFQQLAAFIAEVHLEARFCVN